MRCPLCNRVMMPSYLVQQNGKWYQVHYYTSTNTAPPPVFCTGHTKYDPVFHHDEPNEPERTPVPDVFYDAFDQEAPHD